MGFLALGVVVATSAPLVAQQDGTQSGERLAAGTVIAQLKDSGVVERACPSG